MDWFWLSTTVACAYYWRFIAWCKTALVVVGRCNRGFDGGGDGGDGDGGGGGGSVGLCQPYSDFRHERQKGIKVVHR
jgi:hypothetical protein